MVDIVSNYVNFLHASFNLCSQLTKGSLSCRHANFRAHPAYMMASSSQIQ